VEGANISDSNALVDEVEININMLGALMLDCKSKLCGWSLNLSRVI
jgi:hypothetical protein